MMSLTVEYVLKLPCFCDAQIIAGAEGIGRKISRVSVSECKEFPLDLQIIGKNNMLFREEELFLTSGYAMKDEPELLLDTIKLYSQHNSSGIFITDRYFKNFDPKIIEYANTINYPVVSMKREIPYSDIIMSISQAILLNDGSMLDEHIVDELRDRKIAQRKIISLAYKLNPLFQFNNHAICIFFGEYKLIAMNILKKLEGSSNIFVLFYRNYLLIFFTSKEKINDTIIKKNIKYINSLICNTLPKSSIGVSNAYDTITKIRDIIEESITACETSRIKNLNVQEYNSSGIYKLLLRLNQNEELRRFYNETLEKLNDQTDVKKEEMFSTLELFVKCNGDVKQMAELTFQHVNTIRYRISKLKTLLEIEESDFEFEATVSLLHKIKQLLKYEVLEDV